MALEFASSKRVEEFRTEIDELLLAIAKYMTEEGESPEDWASFTFVSDQSSLADFLMVEDVKPLAQDLQLPALKLLDLLVDVAITMRQRKRPA